MNWLNTKLITYHAELTSIQPTDVPRAAATPETFTTILNIVFAIVGALALLMIVISGLRYILAGGDSQKTAKAKEGIIYALVGLAVALAAQAIVTFVLRRL